MYTIDEGDVFRQYGIVLNSDAHASIKIVSNLLPFMITSFMPGTEAWTVFQKFNPYSFTFGGMLVTKCILMLDKKKIYQKMRFL
jgi:hypothetical protein